MRARIIFGLLVLSTSLCARAAEPGLPSGVSSDELLKMMKGNKSLSVPDPRRDANAFRAEITLHGKTETFRDTDKALALLRHRSAESALNKPDPKFKAVLTVNGHKHEYKTKAETETALRVVEGAFRTSRKAGISIREFGDFLKAGDGAETEPTAVAADPIEQALRDRVVEKARAEIAQRNGRAPSALRMKQIIERETKAARSDGSLPKDREITLDPEQMLALAVASPTKSTAPAISGGTTRGQRVGRSRGQKVGTSQLKNRGSQPTSTPFGEPGTGELSTENVEDVQKTLEGALGK